MTPIIVTALALDAVVALACCVHYALRAWRAARLEVTVRREAARIDREWSTISSVATREESPS